MGEGNFFLANCSCSDTVTTKICIGPRRLIILYKHNNNKKLEQILGNRSHFIWGTMEQILVVVSSSLGGKRGDGVVGLNFGRQPGTFWVQAKTQIFLRCEQEKLDLFPMSIFLWGQHCNWHISAILTNCHLIDNYSWIILVITLSSKYTNCTNVVK